MLGFAIEEMTDSKLDIKIGRVLLTLAIKPWLVPQMLRLAKNSRKAGKILVMIIAATLKPCRSGRNEDLGINR